MISHVVSESELVALTNVSRKVQPKILLESETKELVHKKNTNKVTSVSA